MISLLRKIGLAALLAATFAAPAQARDKEASERFGDVLFISGSDVRISEPGLKSVFAVGGTVNVAAEVRESVHAAGREVRIGGAVGRDVYAAGSDVEVFAPVTGNVIAMGQRVEIGQAATVEEDAILLGRQIEVAAPVQGNASLAGQTVEITAPISGSVQIRAERIRFGPGARIGGTLEYWSPHRVEVPAGVIAPERVTSTLIQPRRHAPPSAGARVVHFIVRVIILLIFAAIFSALLPRALAHTHERLIARPWLSLLLGVVATSALFGSILVLAASIIGLPLAPLVVILAPLVLLAGYLTAAYVIGRIGLGMVRARTRAGRMGVFIAMGVGVVVLALVRLVPILGWVIGVLAVVMGLGAWFLFLLRPHTAPQGAETTAAA